VKEIRTIHWPWYEWNIPCSRSSTTNISCKIAKMKSTFFGSMTPKIGYRNFCAASGTHHAEKFSSISSTHSDGIDKLHLIFGQFSNFGR